MTRSAHPCNHIRQCVRSMFGLAIALALIGCGASQPVRVLPQGETLITASIGGPVVPTSSPIGFIPYTTVGAAHGLSDELTIHGNVHALMAAFSVLGLDAGAAYRVLHQDGLAPEVTASARAIFFADLSPIGAARLYPDLSLTASWDVADGTLAYVGAHGTMQLSDARFFLSPLIGVQIPFTDRWAVQLEGMWQAANVRTSKGIFEGESSIGSTGSVGMFIGVQVRP